MNLEDLRTIQADERGADSPQSLRETFYRDVAAYIEELREERSTLVEESGDPFGSESVRKLTDEIETAEEVAEAIYERRVGKVVKQASLAAMGLPAEKAGLTAEETALFEDLVTRIEENRETVLETVSGGPTEEGGESPVDGGETTPPEEAGEDSKPPDEEEGADRTAEGTDGDSIDRLTVRITAEVGEIFGVDERVYDLAEEDVVTLPTPNAEPLLDRGAAQRLD